MTLTSLGSASSDSLGLRACPERGVVNKPGRARKGVLRPGGRPPSKRVAPIVLRRVPFRLSTKWTAFAGGQDANPDAKGEGVLASDQQGAPVGNATHDRSTLLTINFF